MTHSVDMQAADADLMRQAAAGDKDAFGAIFERYRNVVFRFARTMTGLPDVAEDVTQEVFVVLIRDLHRYQPERATLSTYLYGIARNVSRDRLRRDRRLIAFLTRALTLSSDTDRDDPLARIAATEAGAEIRRALAGLPVKYREVVILCDLHDLSYADAGAVVRASTPAVRARLHRGRHLLRERLLRAQTASLRRTRSSIGWSV